MILCGITLAACGSASARDWPMWGGSPSRNMAADEKGLPATFDTGKTPAATFDLAAARNLKWVAKLGTLACGSPVVAGGHVYVGTNNANPRDPKYQGEYGILLCLDEATGNFLWQLAIPVVPTDVAGIYYPGLGLCSSPTVEGNRLYLISNRNEVLAVSAGGMGDKNEGPFRDEETYFATPASQRLSPFVMHEGNAYRVPPGRPIVDVRPSRHPLKLGPTDADVLWRYDLMNRLSVWPHDAVASAPLVVGDLVFVCSGNGADNTHRNIPSPRAPTLLAFNKKTGALVAADDARIGPRILEGTWSSPALAQVGGRALVIVGGPDGICYAFDAASARSPREGEPGVLEKVWWCDCNPPAARYKDRAVVKFPSRTGPSEIVATPVVYKDRVYVAIGQDTRHGPASGRLVCINAAGTGDLTESGVVWQYDKICRSLSTASIAGGLVFIADMTGTIHCLDADTGAVRWTFETKGVTSGSTLVADGKVYLGNERGDLWALAAEPELKVLGKTYLGSAIHSTPVAANGVLYVTTSKYLFAFAITGGKESP